MITEGEAGFRVADVARRRAIGPFRRGALAVTVEAVGEPSMTITLVRSSGSPLQVLNVRRFRLDFARGERITGTAPARDAPTPGLFLTPEQLRDLGWCRGELRKRLRTAAPLS